MSGRATVLRASMGALAALVVVGLAQAQTAPSPSSAPAELAPAPAPAAEPAAATDPAPIAPPAPAPSARAPSTRSPYRVTPALLALGRETFADRCAVCHGAEGHGDGPDARFQSPAPRDLSEGQYMIRTTESGSLPTDWDIYRTLRRGMPGTSMPGWAGLPEYTTWSLVAFLKSLSPRFREESPHGIIVVPAAPPATAESVARGRRVYERMQCGTCHGASGRGDGRAASTLVDNHDRHVYAFDFTRGWNMKGGSSPEDVYRTFHTGIDGTPMPSYHEAIGESDSWDLVHYTRSLFAQ